MKNILDTKGRNNNEMKEILKLIPKVEEYIDRIVHRFVVDNFLKEYFEESFITTTYACIKNRGMHKATMEVQRTMKHCKIIWNNYYILKMDVRKYFDNIDKDILVNILKRKVTDRKLLWLLEEIIYSNCPKEERLNQSNIWLGIWDMLIMQTFIL